jgi:hypothetical protein
MFLNKSAFYVTTLMIWMAFLNFGFSQNNKNHSTQKYAKKLDRKVSIEPAIGLGIFSDTENFNSLGFSKQVFSGFTPLYHTGLGLNYKLDRKIYISSNLSGGLGSRLHYNLGFLNLSFGAKYFLFNPKKKLNVYATGGIGLSFGSLDLQKYSIQLVVDSTNKALLGTIGNIVTLEKKFENTSAKFLAIQPFIGAGINYQMDKKWGLFIQFTINPSITKSSGIQDNFPNNESVLNYGLVKAGITIQLMKPKPPWVDTSMVPVPDELLALQIEENNLHENMLVKEGKFDISMREGVKHTNRISVNGNAIIIEEDVTGSCKVAGYLYDTKGNLVAQAESTPDGKMIFTDLQKGIYDLSFVLEKPCKDANFQYKIPDPSVEIQAQYYEEGTILDSATFRIEGKVLFGDSSDYDFLYKTSDLFIGANETMDNKNRGITVMLTDSKKRVVKKIMPNSSQAFMFQQLKSMSYEPIYQVPAVENKSGMAYQLMNQFKSPLKEFLFTEKTDTSVTEEDKFYERLRFNITGKVILGDSLTKFSLVKVYLVNGKNKIIATQVPKSDGSFVFKNLKSKVNYRVFFESENLTSKVTIQYKNEEPILLSTFNVVAENNLRLVPQLSVLPGQKVTYTEKGTIVTPKGFGVYVGAFENVINVDLLAKKLQRDNMSPIYLQLAYTKDLNKRFEFNRDFKLYRVLVGEFESEKQAKKIQEKLDKLGYETYLISHFD